MGGRLALLLVLAITAVPVWPLEYNITTTWNGGEIDHEPVQLIFSGSEDGQFLELEILAPFFDDKAPPGPPGQPFYGLWEYEVVEAFFLNDDDQYLEVEVGPHSHHIVLLLNGRRASIRHSLPMEVTTEITNDTWTGVARIPVEYLPKNVTKFNAYAIHGSGENRIYESLYPAPPDAAAPDFHALEYFEEIDLSSVLPDHATAEMSQFWADALQGIFRYQIKTKWNGIPVNHEPVEITLQGFTAGVEMNVTAPFFNDPAPEGKPGEPFYKLWDYEVVEMFFLNDKEEYLEVELGPWGQHLLLLLKGARNALRHSIPLDYIILEKTDPEGSTPGQWKGSAMLPPGYFPPNVTRMNAYAIHGVENDREYQALYPAPTNDPAYPVADFHRLELFRPIDFQFLMENNSYYSQLWHEAIASGSSTVSSLLRAEEEEEEEPVTVLGPGFVFHPTSSPFEPSALQKTPDEISQAHEETASLRKPKPHLILADDQREERREEDIVLFPPQAFGSSEGEVPRPHLVREGNREIEDPIGATQQRIHVPQRIHLKEPAFGFHDTVHPIPHFEDERLRQGDSHIFNPSSFQHPSLFLGESPSQSTSVFSNPGQFPLQAQHQPFTPTLFPAQEETVEVSPFQNQRQSTFPVSQQPHTNEDQPHIKQEQHAFQTQAQFSSQNIRQPETPLFQIQEESEFLTQVPSLHTSGQPEVQNQEQPQFQTQGQHQFQNREQINFLNNESPHIQETSQPQFQGTSQPQFQETNQSQFQGTSQPQFQETNQSQFQEPSQPRISETIELQFQETGQPNSQETTLPQFQAVSQPQFQEATQPQFQGTSRPQLQGAILPQPQGTRQPLFQESSQSQFLNPNIVDYQGQAPSRFQGQGRPPIQVQEPSQFENPSFPAQTPQFPIQNQGFQPEHHSIIPGSESSVIIPANAGGVQENISPEVEQALLTLAEGTPALPPPHPICFELGLVPDPNRCYAFHECVLENGEWQMYSWRCRRGQIFDPVNVACIRGRCSRDQTRRRRVRRPHS